MKKFLVLLLALAMVFSLAACTNEEAEEKDDREEIVENEGNDKSDSDESEDDDSRGDLLGGSTVGEFAVGKIDEISNTWENSFIGIGCKMDSDWTFYSEEELLSLMGQTEDLLDEYADVVAQFEMFYDMMVQDPDGNNINVILEKAGSSAVKSLDLYEYYENQAKTIEESYTNMGYESVDFVHTTVDIENEEFEGLYIESEIQGIDMYQISFAVKCGEYLVTVTVTSVQDNSLDDIINCFYIVD